MSLEHIYCRRQHNIYIRGVKKYTRKRRQQNTHTRDVNKTHTHRRQLKPHRTCTEKRNAKI